MKKEYWDVTDEQLVQKTSKSSSEWRTILEAFGAKNKKSNDTVAFIQSEYQVPRYWARTITTMYLKMLE